MVSPVLFLVIKSEKAIIIVGDTGIIAFIIAVKDS